MEINAKSSNKERTPLLPIVIPFRPTEKRRTPDGLVYLQQDSLTLFRPVERFLRAETARSSLRFAAITQLCQLVAPPHQTDLARLKITFPSLVEKTFGREIAEAIIKAMEKDPVATAARWLSPFFNEALQRARVVMVNWSLDFSAAIQCPDRETAFFVSAVLHRDLTDNPDNVLACQGCGKWFRPDRTNQAYHSSNCAARFRNRAKRQRDKQLSETKKEKGKRHATN